MTDSTNPRVMADNIRELSANQAAQGAKLEALQIYDDAETDTGMKWIDDKNIYRKVLTGTSAEGTIAISVSALAIAQVIDVRIFIKDTDDVIYGTSYRYSNTLVYWNIASGGLNIILGSTAPAVPVSYVVILEYTKEATPSPDVLPSPDPDTRSIEPEAREEEPEPEPIEEKK